MAAFDLIVIVALFASVLLGCLRGFVYEAITLLGWVMAFLLARWFAPEVAQWFKGAINNELLCMALAFGLIFIVVLFLNGIVAFALKAAFSQGALRPADRSLGGLFGVLRGVICLLVLTLFVHIFQWQSESWWAESKSALLFDEAMEVSKPFLRDVLNFDQEKLESQLMEHIKDGLQDRMQEAVQQAREKGKLPAGNDIAPSQE